VAQLVHEALVVDGQVVAVAAQVSADTFIAANSESTTNIATAETTFFIFLPLGTCDDQHFSAVGHLFLMHWPDDHLKSAILVLINNLLIKDIYTLSNAGAGFDKFSFAANETRLAE
jgi:hypothetical protein